MPKTNYSKTIIYKIACKDLSIKVFYIGATTSLRNARYQHKANSQKGLTVLDKCIRDNEGWDNWDVILVEKYPCLSLLEQQARKRHWAEKLKPTLNMVSNPNSNKRAVFNETVHKCVCGSTYKGINKFDHENTDKHKKYCTPSTKAIRCDITRDQMDGKDNDFWTK